MNIRLATKDDMPQMMPLFEAASRGLREMGVNQWQNGYPQPELIANDIANGVSYLLEDNGEIIGTAVISFAGEPTYSKMKGKGWINDNRYAVVHRIAVADECRRKGIAKEILHFTEEVSTGQGICDIRIDTHRDNVAMRSLLKKLGYTHCGVITLTSGAFREAYHKQIAG